MYTVTPLSTLTDGFSEKQGLEPENKKEPENEFIKKASEDKLAGVIQLPDYHIQFEFFEQKV